MNKSNIPHGIVILEGPDACGKTTLQDHLVDMYDAIPIHLTYNKDVAPIMLEYQAENMFKAIKMAENNLVIVDRHWISEVIYANVFRGGSPWPYMGELMDLTWRYYAAIYVLCLPFTIKTSVIRHKENIDQGHPYSDEKFKELLLEYLKFYHSVRYKREDMLQYRIEFEGKNLHLFSQTVLRTLKSQKEKVETWKL